MYYVLYDPSHRTMYQRTFFRLVLYFLSLRFSLRLCKYSAFDLPNVWILILQMNTNMCWSSSDRPKYCSPPLTDQHRCLLMDAGNSKDHFCCSPGSTTWYIPSWYEKQVGWVKGLSGFSYLTSSNLHLAPTQHSSPRSFLPLFFLPLSWSSQWKHRVIKGGRYAFWENNNVC